MKIVACINDAQPLKINEENNEMRFFIDKIFLQT